MTLLLRAIVAADDAGVATELGLVVVSGTNVAALASPWDVPRAAGEADLLEHHRVVQAIFERVPCLPARFGSVFADEDALRARLVGRQVDFASQLARLGHRCELAITCAWRDKGATAPIAAVPANSGRAYLERGLDRTRGERERERRAEAIVARLLGELAIEPAFIRHRTCPRPAVAVSMSALVTRDEIDEINSRLERLGAQLPDVTTVVQGPWAPYTFAVSE
ncbi:MAG: GvpL/GvpF family gas vesicle protein [Candidatus Limnocylindria bacterium]